MKGTADALLAILPSKGKKPAFGKDDEDDDAAPESGEVESNEGELAAAGELASAIKSGDEKAILAAFKDMMETCGY